MYILENYPLLVCVVFWLSVFAAAAILFYRNRHFFDPGFSLVAGVVLVAVLLAGTAGLNEPYGFAYGNPIARYVISYEEMPIQHIVYDGRTIPVVVGRVGRQRCWLHFVTSITPSVADDTKIYRVKERSRLWGVWYVAPRSVYTDRVNPEWEHLKNLE